MSINTQSEQYTKRRDQINTRAVRALEKKDANRVICPVKLERKLRLDEIADLKELAAIEEEYILS